MLRFLTAGESHGPALVVLVHGLPAGLPIAPEAIQAELTRRRLGSGRAPRIPFEPDAVSTLGAVRHARTPASPVAIKAAQTPSTRAAQTPGQEGLPRDGQVP